MCNARRAVAAGRNSYFGEGADEYAYMDWTPGMGVWAVLADGSCPAAAQEYLQTSATADTVTFSRATMDSIMDRLQALEAKQDEKKKEEKKERGPLGRRYEGKVDVQDRRPRDD